MYKKECRIPNFSPLLEEKCRFKHPKTKNSCKSLTHRSYFLGCPVGLEPTTFRTTSKLSNCLGPLYLSAFQRFCILLLHQFCDEFSQSCNLHNSNLETSSSFENAYPPPFLKERFSNLIAKIRISEQKSKCFLVFRTKVFSRQSFKDKKNF